MCRCRVDLRGEVQTGGGFLDRIRIRAGQASYRHFELEEDGSVGTAFYNKGLEGRGIKLSVNDLLIKALAVALIEVPDCNVSFAGENLIKYKRADISVAVSTPEGLITPVITEADTASLSSISTRSSVGTPSS